MKKYMFFLLLAMVGCDDDAKKSDSVLQLTSPTIMKFVAPSRATISFTSSAEWEACCYDPNNKKQTPEWIQLDRNNGESGDNTLIVTLLTANTDTEIRNASIEITGTGATKETVAILQSPGPAANKMLDSVIIYDNNNTICGKIDLLYNSDIFPASNLNYDSAFTYYTFTLADKKIGGTLNGTVIANSIDLAFSNIAMRAEIKYALPSLISSYKGEQNTIFINNGEMIDAHHEEIEKIFEYSKEGHLVKVTQIQPPLSIQKITWLDDKIKLIQQENSLCEFLYTGNEKNNLNIDLFYFILQGLGYWDETATLFENTGTRSLYLPDYISVPGHHYALRYARNAEGYITTIDIEDETERTRSKWQLNYTLYVPSPYFNYPK